MTVSTEAVSSLDLSSHRILRGPLALEVARFGTPLAIGMGLQTTFNLVDLYIVGGLPKDEASTAFAALGFCDMVVAAMTILSYGLSIATGAILSRRIGEGDYAGVRRVAWQSLLLIVGITGSFALAGLIGADAIMSTFGNNADIHKVGADYLRIVMGGAGSVTFLLHLVTIQRALGSSKTPITLLILANALNLPLAVLFVYGPGDAPALFSWGPPLAELLGIPRMSVLGAAWATVLARASMILPLLVINVVRFRLFRSDSWEAPSREILGSLWRIGWPTSSQLVVRVLSMVLVLWVAGWAYTSAEDHSTATALGLVLRLETMALFVGLGWGSASQTFVGQNLGAGNKRRAQSSGWYTTFYDALMMLAFWWACVTWGGEFVRFFYDDPTVIAISEEYISWVSPSYLGLGAGIVLGSAIQGAGATRQTLKLDLLVIVLIQLPLCLGVLALGMPAYRLWQAVALTYMSFAVLYVFNYRRGTFLDTKLA